MYYTQFIYLFILQPHVKMADEAVCLGTAQAKDSYLRVDRILDAIQTTGAEVSVYTVASWILSTM